MMQDIGLLVLRLGLGLTMFFAHGLPKLFRFSEIKGAFPVPIGFGSSFSLSLAIFSEVFCSVALVIGLLTRLTSVPLLITMLVAFFIVHGHDPFKTRELAFIYGIGYTTLLIMGGGSLGLDRFIKRNG